MMGIIITIVPMRNSIWKFNFVLWNKELNILEKHILYFYTEFQNDFLF